MNSDLVALRDMCVRHPEEWCWSELIRCAERVGEVGWDVLLSALEMCAVSHAVSDHPSVAHVRVVLARIRHEDRGASRRALRAWFAQSVAQIPPLDAEPAATFAALCERLDRVRNRRVDVVDMSYHAFGDDVVLAVCDAVVLDSVRALRFVDCGLSTDGLLFLLESVPTFAHLQTLDLCANPLGPSCARVLVEALHAPSLRELRLSRTNLNEEARALLRREFGEVLVLTPWEPEVGFQAGRFSFYISPVLSYKNHLHFASQSGLGARSVRLYDDLDLPVEVFFSLVPDPPQSGGSLTHETLRVLRALEHMQPARPQPVDVCTGSTRVFVQGCVLDACGNVVGWLEWGLWFEFEKTATGNPCVLEPDLCVLTVLPPVWPLPEDEETAATAQQLEVGREVVECLRKAVDACAVACEEPYCLEIRLPRVERVGASNTEGTGVSRVVFTLRGGNARGRVE